MKTVKVYDQRGAELAPMSHYKALSMLNTGKAKAASITLRKKVSKKENNAACPMQVKY